MKTLMINPPIREDAGLPHLFPTGIAIITAVIENLPSVVDVLDLNAERKTREEIVEQIDFTSYTHICIGSLTSTYKYVKWLISIIRRQNLRCKIIVGNSLSLADKYLLKAGADIVVHREAEETIKEIYQGKPLQEIKGISFMSRGEVVKTPYREWIKYLNTIPLPAYNKFPMQVYLNNKIDASVKGIDINMVVSRGCPFNCGFCYKNFGNSYRLRELEDVVSEVCYLKMAYDVDSFCFEDDNFGVNKEWVEGFCRVVKSMEIEWTCLTRVDSPVLNDETLQLMKEAGCRCIGFGFESASPKVLESMNKRATPEQMKAAIEVVRRNKIKINGSWIFGYPGETEETARETIKFCLDNNLMLWWGFATAYPETPLWTYAVSKGFIEDEEEYILRLGDASDFQINYTSMPYEKYHALWLEGRETLRKSWKVRLFRLKEFIGLVGYKKAIKQGYYMFKRKWKQKLKTE